MEGHGQMAQRQPRATSKAIRFSLSATQVLYALSQAMITIIYGPMGSGKSYATCAALCAHARRNKEERGITEVRGCVVRDTLPNIKRSPVPTLQKAFGPLIRFRDEFREATIMTDPIIHLECFGIADLGDLSKLQGSEYAFIWIVEPAPIADTERYSGGMPQEVLDNAIARCARQEDSVPRVFIDMNPADEEHWTFKRLIEPPDGMIEIPDLLEGETSLISKMTYRLPLDENVHLSQIARQAVRVAYMHDPSSYARFVKGEFAPIYHGKKVAEAFNRDWHVAKEVLRPLRGFTGIRMWDSWGEPRCVIGQQLPDGQLRVYEVVVDHTDIEAIIPKVKTVLNGPRFKDARIQEWRDIGDFTMQQHDQSSRFARTSTKVEEAFGTTFEPGPNRFDSIKSAVGEALRKLTSHGDPCVLICPTQKGLIAALSGRWHYKTDASGNVMKRIPEKNASSHVADAFANGVSVLQPWQPAARNTDTLKKLQAKQRRRANSYGQPRVVG